MVGSELNCTIFFLREFFSLALLSERLKQATNNFQMQLVFLPGCKRERCFHSISILQKILNPKTCK